MNKNYINYEVHRTREGTIIEVACGLLTLTAVVLSLVALKRVPTGGALLVQALIFAFVVALLLLLAYCPTSFNIPDDSPASLFAATVRFVRIVSVLLAALSVGITLVALLGWSPVPLFIGFCVLFLPALLWYVAQAVRARTKKEP